ncbi:MAG: hypothetical protein PHC88_06030 [Terrimicrobiaceae bacterium]|nr:hypothetical protein [Terrimicrobiaceae bacterium]
MTPQSSFMVLAPILPSCEGELRGLLASMNAAPGRVDVNNPLIPFAEFDTLHFARLIILDDTTTEDVRAHGLPVRIYPLYLAFLGDCDGDEDAFLREASTRAPDGLRAIFSCCDGFTSDADLVDWMKARRCPAIANYVNWRGRTVARIREEAALWDAISGLLASNVPSFQALSPPEIHAKLREFVQAETSAGRLKLSPESPTPFGGWMTDKLHLVGVPLLLLLFLPLLVVIAPIYILLLRRLEKTDPEICPTADQAYSDALSLIEDHDVTNQFSAMGSLKPGIVRLLTVIGVLGTVDYAARHIVRRGRLGRIRSIHFARWVFLDSGKRMIFFSNYDGSVESYMDEFINKTGFGLNMSFSNGIGYPRTNWLVRDGCLDERKYKEYLRRHTLPTQVWYKAYPGLTAVDLERNTRLRDGVERSSLTGQELREWVALL